MNKHRQRTSKLGRFRLWTKNGQSKWRALRRLQREGSR